MEGCLQTLHLPPRPELSLPMWYLCVVSRAPAGPMPPKMYTWSLSTAEACDARPPGTSPLARILTHVRSAVGGKQHKNSNAQQD